MSLAGAGKQILTEMTERQLVKSSIAWRTPPGTSVGRQLTGGKTGREVVVSMQTAAGDDLASLRHGRADRGTEALDRVVHGTSLARPCTPLVPEDATNEVRPASQ